ncbi:L,D-transpeptidase family protein [Phenylobacterium sp. LjRoot225]|uniref:L,D-transpeptidase family protein n=1 Tax=Phenylobacterium sp. LjRoot225 TaxID=3342285 RepID=UPI003ECFCBE6
MARFRSYHLAGLALAMTGLLALGACQRPDVLAGKTAALALETLKTAPAHGIPADRFHVDRIETLLASTNGRDKAEGARELRAALVDYARAQHGLTVPSRAFPKDWSLKPAAYDAEASLTQALQDGRLQTWLDAQPPASAEYQALQKAYVAYLKIQAGGGWPMVVVTSPQPGADPTQAAALRQRLAFEDPQLAARPAAGLGDGELVAALQRFQAAHGLGATGQLDAPTIEQLNVPAAGRAAQIRASLERLRWLPRQDPPTRIDVNIPAAQMDYFADGKLVVHMLATSGKPGDETPMLASAVDRIVLNPPWNVPEGIAQEEIIPKGQAYLRAKGFVTKDGRLVQQPGPEAALGLVKFDFDNPYAVYMHDTPAKAAFSSTQRAVSHGCVRLAQAVDFAKLLLSNEPGWSPQRVDEVIASGETTHIQLTHKTPVRLIYLTAFPQGDHIAFRPDVYGWDVLLLQMLDRPLAAPKGRSLPS